MTEYLKYQADLSTLASVFDDLPFWSSRFGMLLFQHLRLSRGIDILDLGCATGFPLFELTNVHGESCRVFGIDPWGDALIHAAHKREGYSIHNVALIQGDGLQLPFLNSHFDLIVSNLGINNFADPLAVLSECYRVMRPQARLVLTTNLKGHMRQFYELYRELLIEFGNFDYLDKLDTHEEHRGTTFSVTGLLQSSGFQITRTIEEQFTLRYLDAQAFFNHWLTRLGFLDGWRTIITPEDELTLFTRLEERLNAIAAEQGELTMTIPMLYVEAIKS